MSNHWAFFNNLKLICNKINCIKELIDDRIKVL